MADPSPQPSPSWADDTAEITQAVAEVSVSTEEPSNSSTSDVDAPTLAIRATELNEAPSEAQVVKGDSPYESTKITKFEELPLNPNILKGVVAMKFDRPSQIQAIAIPAILSNPPTNFIGQAQSGSGKTAAFGLSILGRVDESKQEVQALCLAPTRELARQIHDNFNSLAKFTQIKILLAVRDVQFSDSITNQVIVATPGTAIMLFDRRKINPRSLRIFVLDEADDVLKMEDNTGANQVRKVIRSLPKTTQICLFSATYNNKMRDFANSIVPEPKIKVEITPEKLTLDKLFQFHMKCTEGGKDVRFEKLDELLSLVNVGQTIIFTHTISKCQQLYNMLKSKGHEVSVLHGKCTSEARDDTIDKFRSGENRTLISTSVVARGLDVLKVSLVINFDVPMDQHNNPDPETYLHRIGRSARWKNAGLAITFVHDATSYDKLRFIANHYNKVIEEMPCNDLPNLVETMREKGVISG